jgi:hypothetical protein
MNREVLQSISPQELVLSELDARQSFWPQVVENIELAPCEAENVLAIWAHLRRFPPQILPTTRVRDFNQFVEREQKRLIDAFLNFRFLEEWTAAVHGLDAAWEETAEPEKMEELEILARDLFDGLDRFSLAEYAARAFSGGKAQGEKFREAVHISEELLADKVLAFYPAAPLASAMLAAYREDLDEFDFELWLTTCKHRLLEEALEESEAGSAEMILPAEGLADLLPMGVEPIGASEAGLSFRLRPAAASHRWSDAQPVGGLAAGGGQSQDQLIDQLASRSASDSPTNDYRMAWAHFLASAYRATSSREGWREEFLRLAASAGPLDEQWGGRFHRTEELKNDRDWKRRYEGQRVFALEPCELVNEEAFLELLQKLTGASGPDTR